MTESRFEPELFLMEGWYAQPPSVDPQAWNAHLEQQLGFPVTLVSDQGPWLFSFEGFTIDAEAGQQVPALAALMTADRPFDAQAQAGALQQSWDFPEAGEILNAGQHTLLVSEMLARGLPFEQRLALFRALTRTLVELTQPIALYSTSADFFVDPQHWLEVQDQGYDYYGFFNVRSFNISNDPGAQVMDTLGLGIFGVPDLQVHFRDLDNNALAELLYNIGIYLMRQGNVIDDGHTVPGLNPDTSWPCQHEDSLIGPDREVVDLRPEEPYAAGTR